MLPETPAPIIDSNILVLPNTEINVKYKKVSEGDARYVIELEDPNDQSGLQDKLQKQLLKDFWFVDPEICKEELKQRYGIRLDENTEVELYNFQDNFGPEQLIQVASTLALYYHSLKDKSLWKLQSIQVRSKDERNNKSGVSFRGKEFPQQQRFELFPASFEDGKYREIMECTWAQGSTAHEVTHVVLEQALEKLWVQNKAALGWELLDDQLLILPGGSITASYNSDYRNLPSEYAGYQRDDDRAESVVAYLFDSTKLNDPRKVIMDQILQSPEDTPYEIVQKDPVLPQIPEITVKIEEPLQFSFKVGKVTINQNPKTPIPLEEYRKIREESDN